MGCCCSRDQTYVDPETNATVKSKAKSNSRRPSKREQRLSANIAKQAIESAVADIVETQFIVDPSPVTTKPPLERSGSRHRRLSTRLDKKKKSGTNLTGASTTPADDQRNGANDGDDDDDEDWVYLDKEDEARVDRLLETETGQRFTRTELQQMLAAFKENDMVLPRSYFHIVYSTYARLESPMLVDCIFELFDQDRSGKFEYEEFITFLGVMVRGSAEQKSEWFFRLYDRNGDGRLTKQEMVEFLTSMPHKMIEQIVQTEQAPMPSLAEEDEDEAAEVAAEERRRHSEAQEDIQEQMLGESRSSRRSSAALLRQEKEDRRNIQDLVDDMFDQMDAGDSLTIEGKHDMESQQRDYEEEIRDACRAIYGSTVYERRQGGQRLRSLFDDRAVLRHLDENTLDMEHATVGWPYIVTHVIDAAAEDIKQWQKRLAQRRTNSQAALEILSLLSDVLLKADERQHLHQDWMLRTAYKTGLKTMKNPAAFLLGFFSHDSEPEYAALLKHHGAQLLNILNTRILNIHHYADRCSTKLVMHTVRYITRMLSYDDRAQPSLESMYTIRDSHWQFLVWTLSQAPERLSEALVQQNLMLEVESFLGDCLIALQTPGLVHARGARGAASAIGGALESTLAYAELLGRASQGSLLRFIGQHAQNIAPLVKQSRRAASAVVALWRLGFVARNCIFGLTVDKFTLDTLWRPALAHLQSQHFSSLHHANSMTPWVQVIVDAVHLADESGTKEREAAPDQAPHFWSSCLAALTETDRRVPFMLCARAMCQRHPDHLWRHAGALVPAQLIANLSAVIQHQPSNEQFWALQALQAMLTAAAKQQAAESGSRCAGLQAFCGSLDDWQPILTLIEQRLQMHGLNDDQRTQLYDVLCLATEVVGANARRMAAKVVQTTLDRKGLEHSLVNGQYLAILQQHASLTLGEGDNLCHIVKQLTTHLDPLAVSSLSQIGSRVSGVGLAILGFCGQQLSIYDLPTNVSKNSAAPTPNARLERLYTLNDHLAPQAAHGHSGRPHYRKGQSTPCAAPAVASLSGALWLRALQCLSDQMSTLLPDDEPDLLTSHEATAMFNAIPASQPQLDPELDIVISAKRLRQEARKDERERSCVPSHANGHAQELADHIIQTLIEVGLDDEEAPVNVTVCISRSLLMHTFPNEARRTEVALKILHCVALGEESLLDDTFEPNMISTLLQLLALAVPHVIRASTEPGAAPDLKMALNEFKQRFFANKRFWRSALKSQRSKLGPAERVAVVEVLAKCVQADPVRRWLPAQGETEVRPLAELAAVSRDKNAEVRLRCASVLAELVGQLPLPFADELIKEICRQQKPLLNLSNGEAIDDLPFIYMGEECPENDLRYKHIIRMYRMSASVTFAKLLPQAPQRHCELLYFVVGLGRGRLSRLVERLLAWLGREWACSPEAIVRANAQYLFCRWMEHNLCFDVLADTPEWRTPFLTFPVWLLRDCSGVECCKTIELFAERRAEPRSQRYASLILPAFRAFCLEFRPQLLAAIMVRGREAEIQPMCAALAELTQTDVPAMARACFQRLSAIVYTVSDERSAIFSRVLPKLLDVAEGEPRRMLQKSIPAVVRHVIQLVAWDNDDGLLPQGTARVPLLMAPLISCSADIACSIKSKLDTSSSDTASDLFRKSIPTLAQIMADTADRILQAFTVAHLLDASLHLHFVCIQSNLGLHRLLFDKGPRVVGPDVIFLAVSAIEALVRHRYWPAIAAVAGARCAELLDSIMLLAISNWTDKKPARPSRSTRTSSSSSGTSSPSKQRIAGVAERTWVPTLALRVYYCMFDLLHSPGVDNETEKICANLSKELFDAGHAAGDLLRNDFGVLSMLPLVPERAALHQAREAHMTLKRSITSRSLATQQFVSLTQLYGLEQRGLSEYIKLLQTAVGAIDSGLQYQLLQILLGHQAARRPRPAPEPATLARCLAFLQPATMTFAGWPMKQMPTVMPRELSSVCSSLLVHTFKVLWDSDSLAGVSASRVVAALIRLAACPSVILQSRDSTTRDRPADPAISSTWDRLRFFRHRRDTTQVNKILDSQWLGLMAHFPATLRPALADPVLASFNPKLWSQGDEPFDVWIRTRVSCLVAAAMHLRWAEEESPLAAFACILDLVALSSGLARDIFPLVLQVQLLHDPHHNTRSGVSRCIAAVFAGLLANDTPMLRERAAFVLEVLEWLRNTDHPERTAGMGAPPHKRAKQTIPTNEFWDRLSWLDIDFRQAAQVARVLGLQPLSVLYLQLALEVEHVEPLHASFLNTASASPNAIAANSTPWTTWLTAIDRDLLFQSYRLMSQQDDLLHVANPMRQMDRVGYFAALGQDLLSAGALQRLQRESPSPQHVQETAWALQRVGFTLPADALMQQVTDPQAVGYRSRRAWEQAQWASDPVKELLQAPDDSHLDGTICRLLTAVANGAPHKTIVEVGQASELQRLLDVTSGLNVAILPIVGHMALLHELATLLDGQLVQTPFSEAYSDLPHQSLRLRSRLALAAMAGPNPNLDILSKGYAELVQVLREHGRFHDALAATEDWRRMEARTGPSGWQIPFGWLIQQAECYWDLGATQLAIRLVEHALDDKDYRPAMTASCQAQALTFLGSKYGQLQAKAPEVLVNEVFQKAIAASTESTDAKDNCRAYRELALYANRQCQAMAPYSADVHQERIESENKLLKTHRPDVAQLSKEEARRVARRKKSAYFVYPSYCLIRRGCSAKSSGIEACFSAASSSANSFCATRPLDIAMFWRMMPKNTNVRFDYAPFGLTTAITQTCKQYWNDGPACKIHTLSYQYRLQGQQDFGSARRFQELLEHVLIGTSSIYPYQAMWKLKLLSDPTGSMAQERKANRIWESLRKTGDRLRTLLDACERVHKAYLKLASVDYEKNVSWEPSELKELSALFGDMHLPPTMPIATASLPLQPSFEVAHLEQFPGLDHFELSLSFAGGANHPKILECRGSDGRLYRQLLKNNDDTRQDATMQQVFCQLNSWLARDVECRRRLLHVRTYNVVPLGRRVGVLEWVQNTVTFGDCLVNSNNALHKRHGLPTDWDSRRCREHMHEDHHRDTNSRLKALQEVFEHFHPVFRRFFTEKFADAYTWYDAQTRYTRSVAVASIVGYILGLGDRHPNNLLMDSTTAELVLIDLGIAFEGGLLLPIPERVPFRLTRDVIDGMGIAGTEGTFRACCELALGMLRKNEESVMSVLQVLLFDPLSDWSIKVRKTTQHQIQAKLRGVHIATPLGLEGHVAVLIQEATDLTNLASIYSGWQAWI
ncbi:uncharacterized protein MONBRDRAFT_34416 [Monosiga brevicollis MX1]|uniref:non-specific serine/threonine protein kinase n=1 Tax=Monosiga brevicollis TaxID=81824 RepID=A9VBL4_MONBE|nr:uncharacterized protein MONBRDRAFT_34416 [Monosiga brevicollis MX1]EDQ85084.1 predicted protein [Monosiga brevicollis MX1]|eukprot:XP_001750088.1 hypothetical protein [Monosiga brevicollis MX1]